LYIFLDPDSTNWVSVNENGKEILKLCNGKRTVSHISRILGRRHGTNYRELSSGILEFLNQIALRKFLSDKPLLPPRSGKSSILADIWIHVTNECNLRCAHCHLEAGTPLESELGKEEIFQIIDQYAQLGGGQITISGGEPFCRSDLIEILAYANGKAKLVFLATNGTMIDDDTASRLKEFKNMVVQVSLDGATRETNDQIRGNGSYEKAMKGINALLRAKVQTKIGMTLMKQNVEEIFKMAYLCKTLNIPRLHMGLLQIKGRAKKNQKTISLTNTEVLKAMRQVRTVTKETGVAVDMEEALNINVGTVKRNDFCGAGSASLSVSSDGFVYPCAGLHDPVFVAGNIRKQPLEDIWRNSKVLKKLNGLSVTDIPKCRHCIVRFMCGGNCHVGRQGQRGKLLSVHPYCTALKSIILEKIEELAATQQPLN
jgi:radical SAM protein with 4Fe4S-binding SPASM domain